MNILEVKQSTTQDLMLSFTPTDKHYIVFGEGFIDIQQELRYSHASVNLDLASSHSLAECYFMVSFIGKFVAKEGKLSMLDDGVNILSEKPSVAKKFNVIHPRNFQMNIHLDASHFDKLYQLYMAKIQPTIFNCYIKLDLYQDCFRYLGNAADGTENFLLNDFRDEHNFGCKFKIATYLFST